MVPKVAGRGHSFKGLAQYLLENTAEMEPDDPSRVDWTETGNLATDDIEKAAKVMAWTDLHADDLKAAAGISNAGAKPSAGAVYHYTLAWAHGEKPDQQHMSDAAKETVRQLGLQDHEFFLVAHNDRPHSHVHVCVNLTHPETGRRAELGRDYVKLQKWALKYEREHGLHCEVREENAAKRENGEKVKYRGQKQDYKTQVTRAFYLSDDGKSFTAALENEGLHLAKARRGKGFVVVDEKGEIQDLARQLDTEERQRAKTAAINKKLEGLNRDLVPDGYELSAQIKERVKEQADLENQSFREEQEAEQAVALIDIADPDEQEKAARDLEQELRRNFIANQRIKRADAKHEAALSKVKARQALERTKQEKSLQSSVGVKIDAIQNAADDLQAKVEGKGFKLALRRVWRGRKDREELEHLRHEIDTYQRQIEQERKDLYAQHAREKADLKARHGLLIERMKKAEKLRPDREQSKQTKEGKNPFDGLRQISTGQRVALDTAQKRRARAIEKRAYELRQIEDAKARENIIQQEADRLRANYEKRQHEIREDKKETSIEREIRRQRQNRDQSRGKDKGRDFER